jgi:hypothetical protein
MSMPAVSTANLAGQLKSKPVLQTQNAAGAMVGHATNVADTQNWIKSMGQQVDFVLFGDSITEAACGRKYGESRWPYKRQDIVQR